MKSYPESDNERQSGKYYSCRKERKMDMSIYKRTAALVLSGVMTLGLMAGCSTTGTETTPSTALTTNGETNPMGAPEANTRNDPITVISREEGSGTRGAFVEIMGVVDADEVDATVQTAEVVNSTAVVTQTVAGNPAAIGYISMGSLGSSVKALAVDGAEGTVENVKNGSYAVSRPFNICYKEENLTNLGKDFVKFILSADGQAILGEKYIAAEENAEVYTASGLTGNLSINGSTSVGPVMMELAEAYMNLNAGVTIDVQQTGSGAGITAAIDGSCEIGMSSRELKEEELAEGLTPVRIAMDGIAVIVNQANPVTGLTTEQIRNIFLGNTTNWSELG